MKNANARMLRAYDSLTALYFVPTGRTMEERRAYYTITDARRYAIRKMRETGTVGWTVFAHPSGNAKIGRIYAGRYKGRETAFWSFEGSGYKYRCLSDGTLPRED